MDKIHCSAEFPCTAVQLLIQRTSALEQTAEKLEKMLEKMQDRLPPSVVIAGSVGGAVIGVLGTLVAVFASR